MLHDSDSFPGQVLLVGEPHGDLPQLRAVHAGVPAQHQAAAQHPHGLRGRVHGVWQQVRMVDLFCIFRNLNIRDILAKNVQVSPPEPG